MLSSKQTGELSAYGSAMLASLFPIVTVASVSMLSALYSAAFSTAFAALFVAVEMTVRRRWKWPPNAEAWKDVLITSLIIGVIFYALIFTGYRYTSPGNGALVHLTEIVFTFLIVNLLIRHERFILVHALGALCICIGALVVLIPSASGEWNKGDLLILLAMAVPPVGNIFAQRARKVVPADMILFIRSVIGAAFLLLLAWFLEPFPTTESIKSSLWLVVLNGVFLMGLSKILWLEALHRLPIGKTLALTEVSVVLTLIFSYLILGSVPSWQQIISILPMILGVYLLTRK